MGIPVEGMYIAPGPFLCHVSSDKIHLIPFLVETFSLDDRLYFCLRVDVCQSLDCT
jgi:hypothetical protein